MATATKNTRVKTTKTKKAAPENEVQHDEETEVEILPSKNKKPIEVDEPEPAIAAVDEKLEEDPLIAAIEDDDAAEEMSLDGEELNPFGDRWEE